MTAAATGAAEKRRRPGAARREARLRGRPAAARGDRRLRGRALPGRADVRHSLYAVDIPAAGRLPVGRAEQLHRVSSTHSVLSASSATPSTSRSSRPRLELVLGIAVALLLNAPLRARWLWRSIVVLPWALPTIVNGAMWRWFFNAQYGALNGLLSPLGIPSDLPQWLGSPFLRAQHGDPRRRLEEHLARRVLHARRAADDLRATCTRRRASTVPGLGRVLADHAAAARAEHRRRAHPAHHRGLQGVRHHLRHDRRGAGQRHPDDRVLHLPAGVLRPALRLRGGAGVPDRPGHLRPGDGLPAAAPRRTRWQASSEHSRTLPRSASTWRRSSWRWSSCAVRVAAHRQRLPARPTCCPRTCTGAPPTPPSRGTRHLHLLAAAADDVAANFRLAMVNSLDRRQPHHGDLLVVGALGGYAFARLRFRLRRTSLLRSCRSTCCRRSRW